MCGITGFINFSSHDPKEASLLVRKMVDTLAHRGPDEEGFYVDDHAALGHKRLSIIDLSSGQHPKATKDRRFYIVFNGEGYNFIFLRAELEKKGDRFPLANKILKNLNAE
jgi:asparagine synthase (glutamine-hydrolysing)